MIKSEKPTAPDREYWSLDHEREWLASVLSLMTLKEEKLRFVRSYLGALTLRTVAFNGEGEMCGGEYCDMETFCLRLLYELEHDER